MAILPGEAGLDWINWQELQPKFMIFILQPSSVPGIITIRHRRGSRPGYPIYLTGR